MDALKIKLENCYGIRKFQHDFDFTESKAFAIYAPNGAMKTSFANTFRDISNGTESKDLIFPSRITIRDVADEAGNAVKAADVFVIEPYNSGFSSEKMSTLLVNKELKIKYDSINAKIADETSRFVKALKQTSKMKGDQAEYEKEISLVFTSAEGNFYVSLARVEKEVLDDKEPEYGNIVYSEIFNEKVGAFLKDSETKEKIQDYINVFEELVSKSKYFKKGIFTHNNAAAIAKSLTDNGFFDADHSVFLHSSDGDNRIKTKKELEEVIEAEKESILNNPALKKAFEEVDNKLNSNEELRQFRGYLSQNKNILPELGGPRINGFRQKLWISYFKVHKELYENLLKEYQAGASDITAIIEQANAERNNWLNVISIFNKRFSVPFTVKVQNQAGVMLKQEIPSVVFEFKDGGGEAVVGKEVLMPVLSLGERRALYILNIIFEVEARRANGQPTLFIVDDVADSFDYKNKYAIIQYLKEIAEEPLFNQIILTHNFDFFRTLAARFVSRDSCFTVEKSSAETKLVKAEYISNPFKYWMDRIQTDDTQLIASIPFVRNLIEYTKGTDDKDYIALTSLLHIKKDTKSVTKLDLQNIYNGVFQNKKLVFSDPNKTIYDLMSEITGPCLSSNESTKLENKILLSIVIRLRAEEYMFSKLTDKSEPNSKQTQALIKRYSDEFKNVQAEAANISLLQEINLMTPENIHLNSFMYEPILDMSDEQLKRLCREISALK